MPVSRRTLLQAPAWLALSSATVKGWGQAPQPGRSTPTASSAAPVGATPLAWLEGAPPASFRGTSFGLPWPQGQLRDRHLAQLGIAAERGAGNSASPPVLQSWPLAHWPDGSLKWTAHALAPDDSGLPEGPLAITTQGSPPGPATSLVRETRDALIINTGKLRCTIPRSGGALFDTIEGPGLARAVNGRLVALSDVPVDDSETTNTTRHHYHTVVSQARVEQAGPARVLVRIDGSHRREDGRDALPFVLRLYFYRQSDAVRIVHSFIYDLDERQETLRGLGVRFDVPLAGPAQERHVRFVGANGGVFAESVRGLTGLRRDPGEAVTSAQRAGQPLPAIPARTAQGLDYIPAFGDYSLLQSHPDGFSITKRTAAPAGWLRAATGHRAAGTAYLGTAAGGIAFGLRNFWQSYPAQLDIRAATTDQAQLTLWLWAPDAPGMDMRSYHDGLGQDSHDQQLKGLDITYEDYEPGFERPYGVARSSELELQFCAATPSAEALVGIARRIQAPPQLVTTPQRYQAGEAFSTLWSAEPGSPDPATEAPVAALEKRLADLFDFYRQEVETRRWYGFWDYGDVMHTYDTQRHVWRYDVGGFAWDNSELSTEIWLWHYFLHSGRADAFRMAEAMSRHCGEVDVHHAGPFSPLGSRHNVRHWGDSAKQLRVSTAINRRFFYYLATDERTGDLLHEQADAVNRLQQVIAGRKVGQAAPTGPNAHHLAAVAFGTDWGAVAAAWLTEWERTGNTVYRDRLLTSMASIAAQPRGFFTGTGLMDLRTGAFQISQSDAVAVSHLSAAFGLAEVCSELIRSIPSEPFQRAWLDYCVLYNADADTQARALGRSLGALNLGQGHAKLLGYAGRLRADPAMRQRAWRQFFEGRAGLRDKDFARRRVETPAVLEPLEEWPAMSTNAAAQWGLAAIGLLATAAGELPASP
ncbi:hypothetical protein SAMN05216359_108177 [Roseateles sp. YR242]|uniref:exo-rhamnogalacturonan lyase family protein n=1 Tax=Roseateles sp. YR242 TaxID=1855305 RepID=UPI0008D17AA8|nr:Tat pathway signal sequence domain protein [Roseateles sp. YR242]SEL39976.1 hypothetical protein SAMN05216359_108177 [Roseateles sp. YR242]